MRNLHMSLKSLKLYVKKNILFAVVLFSAVVVP